MHTLALKITLAYPALPGGVEAGSSGVSYGIRDAILIIVAVTLFMALVQIRRTFQPLREVIRTLMIAGVATILVLTAFVLVLVSLFMRG